MNRNDPRYVKQFAESHPNDEAAKAIEDYFERFITPEDLAKVAVNDILNKIIQLGSSGQLVGFLKPEDVPYAKARIIQKLRAASFDLASGANRVELQPARNIAHRATLADSVAVGAPVPFQTKRGSDPMTDRTGQSVFQVNRNFQSADLTVGSATTEAQKADKAANLAMSRKALCHQHCHKSGFLGRPNCPHCHGQGWRAVDLQKTRSNQPRHELDKSIR